MRHILFFHNVFLLSLAFDKVLLAKLKVLGLNIDFDLAIGFHFNEKCLFLLVFDVFEKLAKRLGCLFESFSDFLLIECQNYEFEQFWLL